MRYDLKRFRQEIDQFMHHHPQSPLDRTARKKFKGLNYYAEDTRLVFDLSVARFPDDDPLIPMSTSTGDMVEYRRWGEIRFGVEGQEASLVIFSGPAGDDLFLPFKDATNGHETYGAGRYLDSHRPGLWQLTDDAIRLDFNYAYNPYCAYSSCYSCPLPPHENWLKVAIRAGEKKFHEDA